MSSGIMRKRFHIQVGQDHEQKRKRVKRSGNLHLVVVHKLNGLLKSAVLYREIVGEDEKSAGIGPSRVVGVEVVEPVDVDKGM